LIALNLRSNFSVGDSTLFDGKHSEVLSISSDNSTVRTVKLARFQGEFTMTSSVSNGLATNAVKRYFIPWGLNDKPRIAQPTPMDIEITD
jgi:hypothetical protein